MNKKTLSVLIISALVTGCATTENVVKSEESNQKDQFIETGITLDEEGFITDEIAIIAMTEENYLEEMEEILTEDGHTMRIGETNSSESDLVLADNTIYFNFDSSKITSEMKKTTESQLKFLKKYPKIKVILEGHTDERGSNAYNVVLGEKRAKEVKKTLINAGILDSQIEVISYGEMKPNKTETTKEAWKKNRRVVFIYK